VEIGGNPPSPSPELSPSIGEVRRDPAVRSIERASGRYPLRRRAIRPVSPAPRRRPATRAASCPATPGAASSSGRSGGTVSPPGTRPGTSTARKRGPAGEPPCRPDPGRRGLPGLAPRSPPLHRSRGGARGGSHPRVTPLHEFREGHVSHLRYLCRRPQNWSIFRESELAARSPDVRGPWEPLSSSRAPVIRRRRVFLLPPRRRGVIDPILRSSSS
jgi:hypothetical protein